MHSSHPFLSHKMCFADKKIWGLEKKRGWWKLSTLLDEVKSSSRKWFTSLTLWDRREDQLENPVLTVCEVRKKIADDAQTPWLSRLGEVWGKGRFESEHRFSKQNHDWAWLKSMGKWMPSFVLGSGSKSLELSATRFLKFGIRPFICRIGGLEPKFFKTVLSPSRYF